MSDFIEDGYSEQGYIKPADGIHGELTFEFRPALGKLADKITSMITGERPNWEGFWDAVPKALAVDPGLLKSWSLKDSKGNPVPITAVNIQRTKQLLIHKLWMIVAGQMASETPDAQRINPEADLKN